MKIVVFIVAIIILGVLMFLLGSLIGNLFVKKKKRISDLNNHKGSKHV